MRFVEKALIALAALGLFFKLMLYPGGAVLLVISLSALSCLYMFFDFALANNIRLRNLFKGESYHDYKVLRILGAIAMGMVLAMLCTGILFRLMFWPGANVMLIEGLALAAVTLVIVIIKYSRNKTLFYKNALIRTGSYFAVALAFFLMSESTLVKIEYRDYPGYIKAFEAYNRDPGNDSLLRQVELERAKTFLSPEEYKDYEKYYDQSHNRTSPE